MLLEIVEKPEISPRKVVCSWCEDSQERPAGKPCDSTLNYGMCRVCLAGRRSQLRQLPQRSPRLRPSDVTQIGGVAQEIEGIDESDVELQGLPMLRVS